VYGASRASQPQFGWYDPITLTCVAAAAAALALFFIRQTRAAHPVLPLGLFRNRQRAGAYLVILLVGASLSLTYFLSLHVQLILGYGPVRAGLAFLPFAFGIATGSWLAPRLAARVPLSAVAVSGLGMAMVGVLFYRGFTADSSYLGDLLLPMLVWSTGMGLTFVPVTVIVLKGVPSHQAGIASAVLGTMQQIGGAVGLTTLVTAATAVQDDQSTRAMSTVVQARAAGDQDALARNLDAVVHGFAAAYTASLVLLVAAALVAAIAVAPSMRKPPRQPRASP
jgi:hypothetical protein